MLTHTSYYYGYQSGETCNRDGCTGIIAEHLSGDDCSCHINPPCPYCVSNKHYCPKCGWGDVEEQFNNGYPFSGKITQYAAFHIKKYSILRSESYIIHISSSSIDDNPEQKTEAYNKNIAKTLRYLMLEIRDFVTHNNGFFPLYISVVRSLGSYHQIAVKFVNINDIVHCYIWSFKDLESFMLKRIIELYEHLPSSFLN